MYYYCTNFLSLLVKSLPESFRDTFTTLLSKEQDVEECDARNDDMKHQSRAHKKLK